MKTTKKLNSIYEEYKDYFVKDPFVSFHDILWQIMINEIHKDNVKCFYGTIDSDGQNVLALVIENKDGYIPVAFFKGEINLVSVENLANELSEKVFGLNKDECMKIVNSSMFITS